MKNQEIILLDLCCCAGGAAMGYYKAAQDLGKKITIIGVDIKPQPNYPFTFIQGDAVGFLKDYSDGFTHIHASPPCQSFSPGTAVFRKAGKVYPDIIEDVRELMTVSGKPCVIENVLQAPLRHDVILRGDLFGLKVIRKRGFELIGWRMETPRLPKLKGTVKDGDYVSIFGKAGLGKVRNQTKEIVWRKATIRDTWAYAMGIDWYMKDVEISEAIPPAYSKYIGLQMFLNN